MATLPRELRRSLENTIREARRVAEGGARKMIEQLAVHHHEPYTSMTPEQRELRNALRAHGRQLGDRRDTTRGTQAIDRITTECAYEHWHRMLFARFLAETNLLIEPESEMDITLEDCQELARERGEDWLELASQFAERMLPQIFRTNDPVLRVALPPETRAELEKLLKTLSREVFIADDSLGWVYQYWQADKKDEVNRSEKKIGADELPAVTQLFTEDYMVFFLLHNTLGAWWAGKVLAAKPELANAAQSEDELRAACSVGGVEWTYLRFVREGEGQWRPAAGSFEGWPKAAKDITVLDPCMGSGHFLVFALPMLAALRAEEEGLSIDVAIEAALRDNLFGLEIDPRCTQIAAFNLALAAWRRVGHRALPQLHLACSGLSLGVSKAEWLKLAERAAAASPIPPKADLLGAEENLFSDATRRGFERLYELFARAPWIGSLLDPRSAGGDLIEQGFDDLQPLLQKVIGQEKSVEISELAVAAQGLAKAAKILAGRFSLVATNVPYLGREGHSDVLIEFAESYFSEGRADLATLFLRRCSEFASNGGTVSVVTPQNWWVGKAYREFRQWALADLSWRFAVVLGEEAWQTFANRGPNTILFIVENIAATKGHSFHGLDVSTKPGAPVVALELKARALSGLEASNGDGLSVLKTISQESLRDARESRISMAVMSGAARLSKFVAAGEGSSTGDNERFLRRFWEVSLSGDWIPYCGPGFDDWTHCENSYVVLWEKGHGALARSSQARIQNTELWTRRGVLIGRVRGITSTLFDGGCFSKGAVLVSPHDPNMLSAIYSFLSSKEYELLVRSIDPRVSAATSVLTDIPFDVTRWTAEAATNYPNGLPSIPENNPSQMSFNGHPKNAMHPLQVAVARLVGYQWPRQRGMALPGCAKLDTDTLDKFSDHDGIVTLSPVKGDQAASDRVIALLAEAFGAAWSAAKLDGLLSEVGFGGRSLDDWLRDSFFDQHCEIFHQRPFVWHIWDGRRDGFHALVNYHQLCAPEDRGRRTLEKLIYTYLGDWIDRQRADQSSGVEGADARLTASEHLREELTKILNGEPPYDIFVRWKPIHKQPIGWEPAISDGMRSNIRPFATAKPMAARAKDASILRVTPRFRWEKDRGKELDLPLDEFPWFWGWDEATVDFSGSRTFDGNRWNDLHYSRAVKETARAKGQK